MERDQPSSWLAPSRVILLAGVAATVSVGALTRLNAAPATPKPEATIGARLQGFKLKDAAGKQRTLAEFADKKTVVLVFMGTSCPISNAYAEPLSKLSAAYAPKGVQVLGVNANPGEDMASVAQHAKDYRLSFPVLKDADQSLANKLAVRVTPEAFVLDTGRAVRYRGRLDNAYASRTKQRVQPDCSELREVVDALLAGKSVARAVTPAFGCALVRPEPASRSANAKVSFHRDIQPIMQARCQSCHRPGQVAPFSLLTFADAKNWATEIKEFTGNRQMPPWKAEPGHGEFQDARRMDDKEIAAIASWVDAGAPEGNPKDAPPAKEWADGWTLGKPDLVLSMPTEYSVAATGKDDFRCFVLPTGLKEDRDVIAMEVRPGNPRVLHHVLNFVDTTGQGRKLDAADPLPGYNSGPGGIGFLPSGAIGGWAPGNMPRFMPQGMGRSLPKNSDLVIQVHYHKTGKPEVDKTTIGIYFSKEPVKKYVRTFPLTNLRIDIPAGEPRHQVTQTVKLPFAATAIAITPHMHLLGKEMKVTATYPDGKSESLVFIKDWDYRWQDTYIYKQPKVLPRGTQLDLVAYFDNTSANALNPSNPPKRVTFGEETTDEMCFAFIEYVLDGEAAGKPGGLFGARPNGERVRPVRRLIQSLRSARR
ncbi:MAG: redoxin domain-containing protein [Actinomycetota bacterium]